MAHASTASTHEGVDLFTRVRGAELVLPGGGGSGTDADAVSQVVPASPPKRGRYRVVETARRAAMLQGYYAPQPESPAARAFLQGRERNGPRRRSPRSSLSASRSSSSSSSGGGGGGSSGRAVGTFFEGPSSSLCPGLVPGLASGLALPVEQQVLPSFGSSRRHHRATSGPSYSAPSSPLPPPAPQRLRSSLWSANDPCPSPPLPLLPSEPVASEQREGLSELSSETMGAGTVVATAATGGVAEAAVWVVWRRQRPMRGWWSGGRRRRRRLLLLLPAFVLLGLGGVAWASRLTAGSGVALPGEAVHAAMALLPLTEEPLGPPLGKRRKRRGREEEATAAAWAAVAGLVGEWAAGPCAKRRVDGNDSGAKRTLDEEHGVVGLEVGTVLHRCVGEAYEAANTENRPSSPSSSPSLSWRQRRRRPRGVVTHVAFGERICWAQEAMLADLVFVGAQAAHRGGEGEGRGVGNGGRQAVEESGWWWWLAFTPDIVILPPLLLRHDRCLWVEAAAAATATAAAAPERGGSQGDEGEAGGKGSRIPSRGKSPIWPALTPWKKQRDARGTCAVVATSAAWGGWIAPLLVAARWATADTASSFAGGDPAAIETGELKALHEDLQRIYSR